MREYLYKLLLFGSITAALVICCTPDVTWACLDYDLFDFMYSSTYLNVGHAAGFPLYTMLGWLVTRLPGNDAWNLAFFLSVIPTILTCALIFYVVNRRVLCVRGIAPYVAAAAYAGSMIVFSQSIIPELYALTTMLMVLAYVLCERGNYKLGMLAIGFGMTVHYLAVLALPVLIWKYLKPYRKHIGTMMWFIPPLLLYLYIILANGPPHMSLGPNSFSTLSQYILYHGSMLINLPIWELPQRMGEGLVVVLASLGIALLLGVYGLTRYANRTLLWLVLPGVIYYLTTLGPTAYVHMMPAFAFTSIAVGYVAGGYVTDKIRTPIIMLSIAALICSISLLGVNAYKYDIGRTLDPEPTGARQFLTQLSELDDTEPIVIVCWDAVTFAGVFYYNEQTDSNLAAIHPIFIGIDDAHLWEIERYPELNLNYGNASKIDLPPPSGDWLADYNKWAIMLTGHFASLNPHVTVYATLSNQEDRSRRSIWLVEASGN